MDTLTARETTLLRRMAPRHKLAVMQSQALGIP